METADKLYELDCPTDSFFITYVVFINILFLILCVYVCVQRGRERLCAKHLDNNSVHYYVSSPNNTNVLVHFPRWKPLQYKYWHTVKQLRTELGPNLYWNPFYIKVEAEKLYAMPCKWNEYQTHCTVWYQSRHVS